MNDQYQQNRNSWKWLGGLTNHFATIAVALVLGLAIVAGWSWYKARNGIGAYKPSDRAALEKLFRADEYLLLAEGATHFSLDLMFDKMTPSYDYPDQSLSIAVYRVGGVPAGFVTYHRKTPFEGRVQFLIVGSEFRGKGYGKKLLQYATDALQQQGFRYAVLSVRIENTRAIALYQSLGFVEQSRTPDGFMLMVKPLQATQASDDIVPEVNW